MKKILLTTLIAMFVLGIAAIAQAVVLAPNEFAIPTGAGLPPGSTFVTTTGPIPFSNPFYSGILRQNVLLNPTGYLFVYRFANLVVTDPTTGDIVTTDNISRMTTTNFTGFNTWVDAFGMAAGDVAPVYIDRSVSGSTIGFQFKNSPSALGVAPGSRTQVLWVQTDAQIYGPGQVNFLNGYPQQEGVFGPAVPEPASLSLLGLGLLGLLGFRKKKLV